MKRLATAFTAAALICGAITAKAQSLVVVELYTSQGCSSCPAADKLLTELSARDDVLALALHVDYWDYLGWQDDLAQPHFKERQARFNAKMNSRYRLVTPQMIFGGQDYVAGSKPDKASMYIDMLAKQPEPAGLEITRTEGGISISITPGPDTAAAADLHVVQFIPSTTRKIKRGENAGRTIEYTNAVTDWATVATWDGKSPLQATHSVDPAMSVAVILQTEGLGPVQMARRVD